MASLLQSLEEKISVPSLIVITAALATGVNGYLLFFNQTAVFDPLFYIPIILAAYHYPERGVSIAGAFAVLYLLVVMIIPSASHETALASFGHAGIFVITGFMVSHLRLRYPRESLRSISFRHIADPSRVPLKRPGFILIVIILTSVLAIFLNSYLLYAEQTLIFDPLFYFPIIFISYAYPRRGILAATGFAVLYALMVLLLYRGSLAILAGGLVHAGIIIIIGFVVSYIVIRYSEEQEIHKRLAEIVESSGDAIIGVTLDGIITDWNRGAGRLYGYRADEVVSRSIRLLVPPDIHDEPEAILDRIRNGEVIERHETERMTKDGRRIWVSLSVSPIGNDADTIIGASVIAYDITERKLAQDALFRANRKLHLFGSITRHDVLNQLTVLNIYHNLTESMTDDPVARSFLEKAKLASELITRQIRFTHEYEEIGAEKPRWIDVHTGFVDAFRIVKDTRISCIPCEKGLEVYADPLIREVFSKLIDNSITYDPLVSRIQCSWTKEPAGAMLVYEDNGVGIAAGDKQKIFAKAFGDDSRPDLFLTREILSITNITIEENGEPGKGARFVIRIPEGAFRAVNGNPGTDAGKNEGTG